MKDLIATAGNLIAATVWVHSIQEIVIKLFGDIKLHILMTISFYLIGDFDRETFPFRVD